MQMQQSADTADVEAILSALAGLVTEPYDYKAFSYVASGNGEGQVETIVYKLGGSGGTTVATVTFDYDRENLISSISVS
jgi:hypothetical protein